MINPTFFFYPYLPKTGVLSDTFQQIVLKYPEADKYLYLAALSKILSSLEGAEQKEFLYQLQLSEQAASDWLEQQSLLKAAVTEQLERSILVVSSKLV